MQVLGEFAVNVIYEKQKPAELSLVVVRGNGPSLLGRNWLSQIRLNWNKICRVSSEAKRALPNLLEKYQEVFAQELGTIKPFKATLSLKESAKPVFCKARPVPFAFKAAVEETLDRLENDGVLEKVRYSEWAAPVVVVPKRDGQIRLCGDYRVSVNPSLEIDQYPLPKPDELFATLAGGKMFSTLDLSHAYNQLMLDDVSRNLVTINTHHGLYRYTRLPFGIASAPAIFQKTMDSILQGMEGVACFLDDILVTGSSEEEHLKNLESVLQSLMKHGVRLKREKCFFNRTSVEYLGFKVDAEGLHATEEKLKAITEAPRPCNVTELCSFLGLINYYGRFISNLAATLHPLNCLLCKDSNWRWTKDCEQAFQAAKSKLISSHVLVHYNPELPLRLAGDASNYGIGAVISHMMPDGSERPVAFASHTLTSSERNYSQIEKEALSLVYGVRKFHSYLYGRQFTLITDHKPLLSIFGTKKGIPAMAAACLQRWAILLSAYRYEVEFRPTGKHGNADGLSRLPLNQGHAEGMSLEAGIFQVQQLENLPVTTKHLKSATRNDPFLSKILIFVKEGWPVNCNADFRAYLNRKNELSVEDDCLLWGIRVIIPEKLRSKVLDELHREHMGISRMKSVARSYFWWPGVDKAIEELARNCQSCQAVKHSPSVAPLHPWIWPSRPWQRIHLDFAGPFQGTTFLVVVDANSKWPEVFPMTNTTTAKTVEVLRQLFSSYGLPEEVVSDNGPQFISEEFSDFMKANGVKHVRIAPYHPASNGLAERFVQSFKTALKSSVNSRLSLSHRLANYLLSYRSTPHSTTGVSPSSLFLHRHIRTRFDLLRPDREARINQKQSKQKELHDRRAKTREFFVGQPVMIKNLRPGPDWVSGIIVECLGPVSYLVETSQRLLWKRHVDHLKPIDNDEQEDIPYAQDLVMSSGNAIPNISESAPVPVTSEDAVEPIQPTIENSASADLTSNELPTSTEEHSHDSSSTLPPVKTYPRRSNRGPPLRYSDTYCM